eukprot:scaffold55245_cov26-Tisochrysis_lutea.AAC.3
MGEALSASHSLKWMQAEIQPTGMQVTHTTHTPVGPREGLRAGMASVRPGGAKGGGPGGPGMPEGLH